MVIEYPFFGALAISSSKGSWKESDLVSLNLLLRQEELSLGSEVPPHSFPG